MALDLQRQTELMALAFIKFTQPVKDDLSRNEAEQMFGTRWLADKVARGEAQGVRTGKGRNSKIVFSRHALECLRMAEREQARVIIETK